MKISPLKNYSSPKFPTLAAARENPDLLKALPVRWQKIFRNTAAFACAGIIGLTAFAACANETLYNGGGAPPIYTPQPTEEELRARAERIEAAQETFAAALAQLETADLDVRTHHGGEGSSVYVAYFTEQEAFGFIRAKLEAAGLDFSSTPPDYTVIVDLWRLWWDEEPTPFSFNLDLFDAKKGVGVANIYRVGAADSNRLIATSVASEFAARHRNISVGAFYNPGVNTGRGVPWDYQPVTEEDKAEARPVLISNLTTQAQNFLDRLQAEGVLQ